MFVLVGLAANIIHASLIIPRYVISQLPCTVISQLPCTYPVSVPGKLATSDFTKSVAVAQKRSVSSH